MTRKLSSSWSLASRRLSEIAREEASRSEADDGDVEGGVVEGDPHFGPFARRFAFERFDLLEAGSEVDVEPEILAEDVAVDDGRLIQALGGQARPIVAHLDLRRRDGAVGRKEGGQRQGAAQEWVRGIGELRRRRSVVRFAGGRRLDGGDRQFAGPPVQFVEPGSGQLVHRFEDRQQLRLEILEALARAGGRPGGVAEDVGVEGRRTGLSILGW